MATINNIKKRADEIKNAYEPESVTAEKVGKLFEDIADVIEQAVIANENVTQEAVQAASDAAGSAASAAGYLDALNEAIEALPDGQAVSAEVADHEVRVSDLEDNAATKAECAEKYGDLATNPEFMRVSTDSEDRIIEAVRNDGSMFYSKPIDAPNINQAEENISALQGDVSAMSDDVTKSAIKDENGDTVETPLSVISNDEWLEAYLDSDGRIVYGIKSDGMFYFHGISPETQAQLFEINEKMKRRVVTLTESAYYTDNLAFCKQPTDLEVPTIPQDETNVIQVGNATELASAIAVYNAGANVTISLTNDILLTSTAEVSQDTDEYTLTINGNGHKISIATATYTRNKIIGGKGSAVYGEGDVENCAYISNDFKPLRLLTSRFYEACSDITNENGIIVSNGKYNEEAGIRKFLLPDDFDGVSFDDTDDDNEQVFINFSTSWRSWVCKVTKITYESAQDKVAGDETPEGTYLYFTYAGGYSANFERWASSGSLYASFFLINFDALQPYHIGNAEGITIKDGKLYSSPEYTNVYKSDDEILSVEDNSGLVVIRNLAFVGGTNAINIDNSKVIVEDCSFTNCFSHAILADNDAEIYCLNSNFDTLQSSCIYAKDGTTLYAVGNKSFNTGLDRDNSKAFSGWGKYYIADNTIEDYGYSGCGGGLWGMETLTNSYGIIENNIIRQTPEYMKYAKHRTLSDGGVIYMTTNNYPYTIIRYNKVINGMRRRSGMGIYLDDGAYNTYVFGNVVENVPKYSIYNRLASPASDVPSSITANTNKVFFHNICDNAIMLVGANSANNGCFCGVNLIGLSRTMSNVISNVDGREEQLESDLVTITDGVVKGVDNPEIWVNK
jgi:hypothetical protein